MFNIIVFIPRHQDVIINRTLRIAGDAALQVLVCSYVIATLVITSLIMDKQKEAMYMTSIMELLGEIIIKSTAVPLLPLGYK